MATEKTCLDFDDLASGMPGLTPSYGGAMAQAASVCLDDCGHGPGVELSVSGDVEAEYELSWSPDVDDQMRRTWNDHQFATEQGAYGIAILVVRNARSYTVVERSRKGTGFDYWLGEDGDELFSAKARLEVSGIRRGSHGDVNARVAAKATQIGRSGGTLPGIVAVVEFGRPVAQVVDR